MGAKQLNVPVIDHWWQTETGWPIGANCVGLGMLPVKPGSCTKPVPGYDVRVLGEDGKELPSRADRQYCHQTALAARLSADACGTTMRLLKSYLRTYSGYYLTADAGYKDEDGYLWIMSRTDDIINVAGHRLSTGAMEEVLACSSRCGRMRRVGSGR